MGARTPATRDRALPRTRDAYCPACDLLAFGYAVAVSRKEHVSAARGEGRGDAGHVTPGSARPSAKGNPRRQTKPASSENGRLEFY